MIEYTKTASPDTNSGSSASGGKIHANWEGHCGLWTVQFS